MAITPAQLAERVRGIGSSEAAAWLGCDPHKRLADCVAEKLGIVAHESGGSQQTRIGTHAEAMIASVLRDEGYDIHESPETYVRGVLRANVDLQMFGARPGCPPVECKTGYQTTLLGIPRHSGDDSEELTEPVYVQVMHQIICTGAAVGYVAALRTAHHGSLRVDLFEVPRHASMAEWMESELTARWERFVVNREPVPDTELPPSRAVLERMPWPVKHETVEVGAELIDAYQKARVAAKDAEAAKDIAYERLVKALQDAGGPRAVCGPTTVTYSLVKGRDGFDADKLKAERPDLFRLYAKPGAPYRTLRVTTKGKPDAE